MDPLDAGTFTTEASSGWTGPIISGSYQKNATSALTYSYVLNEAIFNVPKVIPGGYGTGTTAMTIWNGLDNVFQAIVDVNTTSTIASYGIHHQEFEPWSKGNDEGGTLFTPNAGDQIYAQEWYCDAQGNVNLSGGYACTLMVDQTQLVEWECDQANSSDCESYTLKPGDLGNGKLGFQAEYIIEDDSNQPAGNCPAATSATKCYDEWPDFTPVIMNGSAEVVQGSGVSATGKYVSMNTDPSVLLLTDGNASIPLIRGGGHLQVAVSGSGVIWTEVPTNVYNWNGSNFNTYSPACAGNIAVGPNAFGLTNGTPWATGCHAAADGNYDVNQMQKDGTWVDMQDDVATWLAVSPEGNAWALNKAGQVLYWNGSKFVENAKGGCATFIAVGPSAFGLSNGTPWTTGCTAAADGNYAVYEMQTGGNWVEMQKDVATQLAVSPDGDVWAINAAGNIMYWNGSKFVENAKGGCATSIGVGPSAFGLSNGTPWTIGCRNGTADGNFAVYEMQTGGNWVEMQSGVGYQIAVSPAGIPWVISSALLP
ncbi:MAG TPA: hypothetical protein VME43_08485 [Bryobacteraceae bacterium]|nr:hypothetical protein [Bryobacteraceae bacterium]